MALRRKRKQKVSIHFFGRELCKIYGVDPDQVLGVDIDVSVGELPVVRFQMLVPDRDVPAILEAIRQQPHVVDVTHMDVSRAPHLPGLED